MFADFFWGRGCRFHLIGLRAFDGSARCSLMISPSTIDSDVSTCRVPVDATTPGARTALSIQKAARRP